MPRAAALSKASAANRSKKSGAPKRRPAGGGVNLPNLPDFIGPPPGTFDPGLEAQVRAAERGLIDLIEKTRQEGRRETQDVRQARNLLMRKIRQGRADLQRSRGYALEDSGVQRGRLETSFARDLQDLAIAKQRGQEDYDRALVDMQHRYSRIGAEQDQASVAQGTDSLSAQAASGAVRGANQAYDKGGIDTAHRRAEEALALQEGRTREDYTLRSGLLGEDLERELTGLGIQQHRLGLEGRTQNRRLRLDALRGRQDRRTAVSQGIREYGIYATDLAQQAYYQAHQLNPKILFPVPSAAAPAVPRRPRKPAVSGGVAAPAGTRRVRPQPALGGGRRAYTRH